MGGEQFYGAPLAVIIQINTWVWFHVRWRRKKKTGTQDCKWIHALTCSTSAEVQIRLPSLEAVWVLGIPCMFLLKQGVTDRCDMELWYGFLKHKVIDLFRTALTQSMRAVLCFYTRVTAYNFFMSSTATWSICRYQYQSKSFVSPPACRGLLSVRRQCPWVQNVAQIQVVIWYLVSIGSEWFFSMINPGILTDVEVIVDRQDVTFF